MAESAGIIIFYVVYMLFVLGLSLAMYLFQGFGIYKMSKNMGLSAPWLAFIPVASNFAFGRIAEKYIKLDGRPSAKFSKILLILNIIMMIFAVAFIALVIVIVAVNVVNGMDTTVIEGDIPTSTDAMSVLSILLPILLGYFLFVGLAIAYNVVYYIALWRIFAIYNYNNATLFLVLSIFFSFLYPIFLFILRNKEPKFTVADRTNYIM